MSSVAAARSMQAERLADLPQTYNEAKYSDTSAAQPTEDPSGIKADMIAADAAMVTYYSGQASDALTMAIAWFSGAAALVVIAIHQVVIAIRIVRMRLRGREL